MLMMGEMREAIGETPEKGKMRKIKMIVPYWRMTLLNSMAIFLGRMPKRIFSPSRG